MSNVTTQATRQSAGFSPCQWQYRSIKAEQRASELKLVFSESAKDIPNSNLDKCNELKNAKILSHGSHQVVESISLELGWPVTAFLIFRSMLEEILCDFQA